MPPTRMVAAFTLGAVLGAAAGASAGWLGWGRELAGLRERVGTLEAAAAQVQGERDRLHRELGDLVRERHEMADTAEHLRRQVEEQIRRLESLAQELAPPEGSDEPPTVP